MMLLIYLPCNSAADRPPLSRICYVYISSNVKLHPSADLPVDAEVHVVCVAGFIEVIVTLHKAAKSVCCTEAKTESCKSSGSRCTFPFCTDIVSDAQPVAYRVFKKEIQ